MGGHMFGTIFALILTVGLFGCAGGEFNHFYSYDHPVSGDYFQNAQGADSDGEEPDLGYDPGSGSAHPSLEELGSADVPGGTTDEPFPENPSEMAVKPHEPEEEEPPYLQAAAVEAEENEEEDEIDHWELYLEED